MASAQATQSSGAASVTARAANLEESLQALTGILTEVRELSRIAEGVKRQIEQALGGTGGRSTDTINLLLQTQRRVDSVTIDEKYIEVEADVLEEREVRGEEIMVYTDSEGHEYEVDRSSEIVKDGAKTYLAVRGV
jgi:hypothetical protein